MDSSLNTITLQQILIFLTVVEESGFAKASTKLHMTQSAVSKSIAKLEKELELPLFVRTTRFLELTRPGELLYHEWKTHIDGLQAAYQRALRMEKEQNRIIRIGLLNTARPERYFPQLVQNFARQYPDIQIEVESQYMNDLEASLDRGQFDLILVADFKRFGLEARHKEWCYAAKDTAFLLTSKQHPLAKKSTLTTTDLRGTRFITVGESESDNAYLLDLTERLKPYKITPEIAYRYKTAYDIRYLFQPDDAALMIDAYFDYPTDGDRIVKIPILDQENGIICAWNPNNANPSLKLFLKTLPYYNDQC